jgi:hypothetical protein
MVQHLLAGDALETPFPVAGRLLWQVAQHAAAGIGTLKETVQIAFPASGAHSHALRHASVPIGYEDPIVCVRMANKDVFSAQSHVAF